MGGALFTQSAEHGKILEYSLSLQLSLGFLAAFIICAGTITLALPYAARLALALPNARSSHKVPTPQSGGLFVLGTMLVSAFGIMMWDISTASKLGPLLLAVSTLGFIGWLDDRRSLPVWFRLPVYAAICVAYAFSQNVSLGLFSTAWLDALIAAMFVLVLINITNFMDGIDGMLVAEFVPMLCTIAVLAAFGAMGVMPGLVAASLAGALLGFFVFNRPKAKIFLGDSGSLVVGFISAVLLLDVGSQHGRILALTLPLYFLCDAGITLLRRLLRGERIWLAHREHYYQRALDSGQSNWSIIGRVALCNVALSGLCFVVIRFGDLGLPFVFVASVAAVALLVFTLSRPNRRSAALQDVL